MSALEFAWPWFGLLLPLPFLLPLVLSWLGSRRPSDTQTQQDRAGQRVTLLHPQLEALESAYHARRPGPIW